MSDPGFSALADHLGDPLLLLDDDFRVVAANAAARRNLGVETGTDLPARTADGDGLRRYLRQASRSTRPLPGHLEVGGDAQRWRCDASRLRPGDGGEPRIVLHLRPAERTVGRFAALDAQIRRLNLEIGRRMVLEEEREALLANERRARREAEEANRLKDEFLAAVSHELRTPLNAIAGWIDLLAQSPRPENLERGLKVLQRNVSAQTQIIEDLVDVSRMVTGRMRLDLQPVDLAEVVGQAIDGARPATDAKDQRLQLIAATGGCTVNADPDRVLQIVWNLISNATKFTPRGGRIQVVLRRVNSHVEIVVSDTGEGIETEVLPYVFDRFRQADGSTTRRHGGLGLGLSIVRHLVELHGGVVMAHSDGPGRGATFTVNLPLPIFERKPAATLDLPDDAGRAEGARPLAGYRVLLIEDHDDSRELLQTILASNGADVLAVARAEEALVAFAENRLDMVVSDIELPGDDGFTLMRKLRDYERRQERPLVPAVAVTAHSIGGARVHALKAGYQAFLVKPIHPPELIALIGSLCEMGDGEPPA